jgi:hypothetical protein
MHDYTFDVKFFSVITLKAPNQATAEAHLERLVDGAEIAFGTDKELLGSTLIQSSLSMDDEEFPFLTLIDDKELWEIEEENAAKGTRK